MKGHQNTDLHMTTNQSHTEKSQLGMTWYIKRKSEDKIQKDKQETRKTHHIRSLQSKNTNYYKEDVVYMNAETKAKLCQV